MVLLGRGNERSSLEREESMILLLYFIALAIFIGAFFINPLLAILAMAIIVYGSTRNV